MIRKQLFYLMLCTCILCSCEKDVLEPEIPEKPPIENPDEPEQPEKPEEKPSTDGIINFKNEFMIVGQNSWWYSVAYGNGKIVAVGSNRYVTTSTDGNNWTTPKQLMNDGNAWYTVTYGNGKFVVVGSGGNIATSTDGINWSIKSVISYDLSGITYGNENFVICKGDKSLVSTDGITWNIHNNNGYSGHGDGYNSLCYGNGKFVKVYNKGDYGYANTSTDGINWTSINQVAGFRLNGVAYGNGKFVAVGSGGNIAISADGINWLNFKQVGTKTWSAVAYGNGKFAIVGTGIYDGSGYITTSEDGDNWSTIEKLDATNTFYGVCAI